MTLIIKDKSEDDDSGQELEQFLITCKNCDGLKRKHETNLYIDWNKKYYMIICYTCGIAEAFNEKGHLINLKPKSD